MLISFNICMAESGAVMREPNDMIYSMPERALLFYAQI